MYGRSLEGGGWISRFGRLPPAETDLFLLMTGVDVEGRRETRHLAGVAVVGVGAGVVDQNIHKLADSGWT